MRAEIQEKISLQDHDEYKKVAYQFYKEALPFFLTRAIEFGVDFFSMAMLSSYNLEAEAAGSLITSSQILLRSVNAAFLFFTGVLTRQLIVQNKKFEAGSVFQQSLFFSLILSIPTYFFSFYSASILKSLHQPEVSSDITQEYLRSYSYGIPFTFMLISAQQLVLGHERPYSVLLLTALFKPLKFLGYYFIYGKWGNQFTGASGLGLSDAISTALNFFAFFGLFAYLSKEFSPYQFSKPRLRSTFHYLGELAKKGLPIGIYTFIEIGSLIFSTILVGQMGKDLLAASQPALQYAAILAYGTFAVAHSAAIMTGEYVKKDRQEVAKKIGIINVATCISFSILSLMLYGISSASMMNGFFNTESYSAEIVSLAKNMLLINLLGQLFDAMRNAAAGNLRGRGDTKTPMKVNVFTAIFINIIPACVFDYGIKWGGVESIFYSRNASIFFGSLFLMHAWYKKTFRAVDSAGYAPLASVDLKK